MEREPRIEFNFSMQNMVDASTLWAAVMPIEVYASVAKQSGYSGIEYFPHRIPYAQVKTGVLTHSSLRAIKSAHQSFREEKSIREIPKHPQPILAAQAFLLMPETITSLDALEKLQLLIGSTLPVVVYPTKEWLGEERPKSFDRLNNKLIQPAPELIEGLGQSLERADDYGYKLCLDLLHFRRFATQGFQTQFGHWQETLPQFLSRTNEIHLAVGRPDFEGNFDSMKELYDIYSGERKTDIIPMLEFIRDWGWRGSIVTEIPANSAGRLVTDSRIAKPRDLVKAHQQIVCNLKEIMEVN